MTLAQGLLREYAALKSKSSDPGLTPLEYQRWLDLRQQLDRQFPDRAARATRSGVRLRVTFKTLAHVRAGVMHEVRPVGVFVGTPFAATIGTCFELSLSIAQTGESFLGDVIVVSNNVGPGFSTRALGMGLRLRGAGGTLRELLDRLFPEPDAGRSAAQR
jgi:hypothetical protein